MGRKARRKQDIATIECVTGVVYENIAKILDLDPESNYQERKQVYLKKLQRVYSKLPNKKKAIYVTIECWSCIADCLQKNRPEFEFQYSASITTPAERVKLKYLLENWQELQEISFREIANFLVPLEVDY